MEQADDLLNRESEFGSENNRSCWRPPCASWGDESEYQEISQINRLVNLPRRDQSIQSAKDRVLKELLK